MSSTLSLPRIMLRHLAARATQNPIEVVVSIFIIVTLCYFQLLHAVATSNFFEPLNTEASLLVGNDADRKIHSSNVTTIWDKESSLGGLVFVRKAHSNQWVPISDLTADVLANSASSKRFDVEPILIADSEERPSHLLSDLSSKIQSQLFSSSGEDDLIVFSYPLQDATLNLSGYGLGRISIHSDEYSIHRKKLMVQSNDAEFLQHTVKESIQRAAERKTPVDRACSLLPSSLTMICINTFHPADWRSCEVCDGWPMLCGL